MNDFISLARQIFAPDHGPAFRQVTSYLSRNDLKNLRLTCFTLYDIIPKYDNSFIPTLKLTEKIELGDHFFRSDNQVHVEFPKSELFTDQMSSLVQRLDGRIKAITVSPHFLSTFKQLRFSKLESIYVTVNGGYGKESNFEDILSLICTNAATLRSLKFYYIELPDNIEMLVDLPVLQQLQIRDCDGDEKHTFLLSVVKKASQSISTEVGTRISTLKMLYIEDRSFESSEMSTLLTSVPNLEQLTMRRCDFSDKLNVVQLTKLRKLDVLDTRGVLPAIIQSAVKLQELAVNQHVEPMDTDEDSDTDDEDLEMNDENIDEIALVKKHLANNTLKKLILHEGENEDDEYGDNDKAFSESTLELLVAHSSSLEALEIYDLEIWKSGEIWDSTLFPKLKKLRLRCEGEYSLLLKQCPILEELEVGAGDSFCIEKKLVLPCLKRLALNGLYYNVELGHVLKCAPILEELTVRDCNIFILENNFNLSCLKKLYLSSVDIGKDTSSILAAKLPRTMSLDLEQFEYCQVLDDDDFFRLAPQWPTDYYLSFACISSMFFDHLRAVIPGLPEINPFQ